MMSKAIGEGDVLCESNELVEAGTGLRFQWRGGAGAFAIRFAGEPRAYVNRCPHMGTELDWQPGDFFDESGAYLVCATHGALFEPHNGHCIAGPCRGASLEPIGVRERNGRIFLYNESPAAPAKSTDEEP
jgi:nitrite reductase/ring-hydroxylating ferredoxin subunit